MKKIQLTIPEPCHEDWDKMTPQEKGRFCGSCQKTVVDFTDMSDREIAEFFKNPPGSVCGHLQQGQLGRDINLPRKRIPWIRYFFQVSLPALLISAKASAQGKVLVTGDTVCVTPDSFKTKKQPAISERRMLQAKVTDAQGRPVPSATVMIRGTKYGVATNDSGEFRIEAEMFATLDISSVGFVSRSIMVRDFTANTMLLKLENDFTGEIIIVKTTRRKKKKEPIPVTTKIMDTAFKHFKVFPNPARNNSYLKIDCGKLENGEYVVSVIDMNGEVLQTQEIVVDNKKKQFGFYLEDAKAGTYIIHLFNRRSTASFSEKIIVQ